MITVPGNASSSDPTLPDRLSCTITKTTAVPNIAFADAGGGSPQPLDVNHPGDTDLYGRLAAVEAELAETTGYLEQLFLQFDDPILVISAMGVILAANKSAEQLFQCSNDTLVGTVLGTPMRGREGAVMEIHRRYGDIVTTDARISLTNWNGETAFTVTLRDVGKRCQTTDTIGAAKQAAEHANRMKSQFLANMSHELRTPLNSILGFTDVMRSATYGDVGNERYRKYIDYVYVSGKQLLDLINDLLYLAKAEAGKLELHSRSADIADIVMSAVETLKPDIVRKQLNLVASGPLPHLQVQVDEAKVSQILVSLLSNAVKFTLPEGQIKISLALDRQANLRITIADTGIGIAPAVLANIFHPFVHFDQVYSYTGESGSGLNLALARRLAVLHGGDIELESEVNVGSKATLVLPANRINAHHPLPEDREPGGV